MKYKLPITEKPLDQKSLKNVIDIKRRADRKGSDHRMKASVDKVEQDMLNRYEVEQVSVSAHKAELLSALFEMDDVMEFYKKGQSYIL